MSILIPGGAVVLLSAGLSLSLGSEPVGSVTVGVAAAEDSSHEPHFVEVATKWGIDFVHHHGGTGKRYMVETMVGGVVLWDYDLDGDVDVLMVDGGVLPASSDLADDAPRTRLYRNDLGASGPRFVDVTTRAGLDFRGYGVGGAAGDIDNDGDPDLYLTAFGKNALFRNNGDGTFTEIAEEAGVADPLWSASASFADVDRDGDLDLYVANYVDFTIGNHKFCGREDEGIQGYCHPDSYQGLADRFYRNLGNGRFEDATRSAGLEGAKEAGLGVVFTDLDGDLYPELYVANDLDPNLLFANRGGRFEDVSLISGTAYSNVGKPEAGMGVESADLDGDGQFDLVVTNFALETNALYKNAGAGVFVDRRFPAKLVEPSLHKLGFGVVAIDVDHDQDQDLVIANGHILDNAELLSEVKEYAQRNQLMLNDGAGRFSDEPGSGLDTIRVSRGLAVGDLDADGDLDLVFNNSNQRVEVYENRRGSALPWLLVELVGSTSNADGIGARLELDRNGKRQVKERRTASSYLSQNALAVHFGLGERVEKKSGRLDGASESLDIFWPSGKVTRLLGRWLGRRLVVFE